MKNMGNKKLIGETRNREEKKKEKKKPWSKSVLNSSKAHKNASRYFNFFNNNITII